MDRAPNPNPRVDAALLHEPREPLTVPVSTRIERDEGDAEPELVRLAESSFRICVALAG
jgi:hypothetical protein